MKKVEISEYRAGVFAKDLRAAGADLEKVPPEKILAMLESALDYGVVDAENDMAAKVEGLHIRAFDRLEGRYKEMTADLDDNLKELTDMKDRAAINILKLQGIIRAKIGSLSEETKDFFRLELDAAIQQNLRASLPAFLKDSGIAPAIATEPAKEPPIKISGVKREHALPSGFSAWTGGQRIAWLKWAKQEPLPGQDLQTPATGRRTLRRRQAK